MKKQNKIKKVKHGCGQNESCESIVAWCVGESHGNYFTIKCTTVS